jgi:3-phosphoshikimate 1-carboxyvinyltransferase
VTLVRLEPSLARGTVRAPPSKSYTHRALAVGHLAGRQFRVEHPLEADDTRRTAAGIARLGTPVRRGLRAWIVGPPDDRRPSAVTIDCGESGTTLRFLTALAARQDRTVRFTGRGRLGGRPMEGLVTSLRGLGASLRSSGRGLPLEVRGPIHGGRVRLDASVSSQYVSALLLALPGIPESSRIDLVGPVVSAPYIDATLAILAAQRVNVRRRGRAITIPGGQTYRGGSFRVPGDASSAAYLWAAAAVTGGRVRVNGVPSAWPQADRSILPLLERGGAEVADGGDTVVVRGGRRRPFSVDLTDAPDLYPLAGVLAATTPGRSRLVGADHVVHKESDRKAGTARLARAFGARVTLSDHALVIEGTERPRAVSLADLTDHRLLMSAAVGSLAADGPSRLGPAESVDKSFPAFWRTMRALGAEVRLA